MSKIEYQTEGRIQADSEDSCPNTCEENEMTGLYRVQATIWIEAESGKEAADSVYNNLSQLAGVDGGLIGVEVEEDGEFVEELA